MLRLVEPRQTEFYGKLQEGEEDQCFTTADLNNLTLNLLSFENHRTTFVTDLFWKLH